MYTMHDGYGGWMFGGMWTFSLLFWVFVIVGVFYSSNGCKNKIQMKLRWKY